MKIVLALLFFIIFSSCGESWTCQTQGDAMFSVSDSGEMGSAEKECTCEQIRAFEIQVFGEVDGNALKNDLGC